jgi:glycosyltransferase involved in cell wall biosynthesis
LLYVGLRGGYKNFERLLQAVACSKSLRDDFDVVAFGGGSFNTAELALIQRLNFAPNQIRQNSGSDQSLSEAYSAATAFVYPSIYEGFGLPPLEAMAHSCPVVSSNTSSMPEVIGDAAEYFDPLSLDDIASAIERVVLSNALTQSLIERGRLRAQRYTWKACAAQHLQLYDSLAQRATSR